MDILGVILAIFTGPFGGYRFYRRQYFLGIIYLFTAGLCGIGWIIDIIASLQYNPNNQPQNNLVQPNDFDGYTEVVRMHTRVVGSSYPCIRLADCSRQDILHGLSMPFRKDRINIEYTEYDGEPAYLVVRDDGVDIGYLKKELSAKLAKKYPGCPLKVTKWVVTGGDGRYYGCNIEFVVLSK